MLRLKVTDNQALTKSYEFYADVHVLRAVVNPPMEFLSEAANQPTLKGLADLLNNFTGREEDQELIDAVNQRMTDAINQVLKVNMGLAGWSIDSYREDIMDILKLLGEQAGMMSRNVLNDSAAEIIGSTLSHFTAEEGHAGLYEKLGLEMAENECVLIWRERTSITRLPLTSQELGLPAEARRIEQGNNPALYSAAEAIMARTQDHPVAYRHRYIALADGKVYELVVGYYDRSALILQRADFLVAQ